MSDIDRSDLRCRYIKGHNDCVNADRQVAVVTDRVILDESVVAWGLAHGFLGDCPYETVSDEIDSSI